MSSDVQYVKVMSENILSIAVNVIGAANCLTIIVTGLITASANQTIHAFSNL